MKRVLAESRALRRLSAVVMMFIGASAELEAQSIIRLTDKYITAIPASGNPPLASHKMAFGTFAPGFAPTVANFSQWDENFRGVYGAHTPGTTTNLDIVAEDNSVHAVGDTLHMLVFDIAPEADVSTATSAILLTRVDWVVDELGPRAVMVRGRLRYLSTNYQHGYYDTLTTTGGFPNYDEDNFLPLADPEVFTSSISQVSMTPTGQIEVASTLAQFSATTPIPEASTLGLGALALAAASARRLGRRARTKG
jgi:hypothetical protein